MNVHLDNKTVEKVDFTGAHLGHKDVLALGHLVSIMTRCFFFNLKPIQKNRYSYEIAFM